jgi:glycosyltransferase involved in cell wall biosynthesis
MSALTHDPRRRDALGHAARQRIEQNFSWPQVAERHLELYRGVIGAGRDA